MQIHNYLIAFVTLLLPISLQSELKRTTRFVDLTKIVSAPSLSPNIDHRFSACSEVHYQYKLLNYILPIAYQCHIMPQNILKINRSEKIAGLLKRIEPYATALQMKGERLTSLWNIAIMMLDNSDTLKQGSLQSIMIEELYFSVIEQQQFIFAEYIKCMIKC